MFKRFITSLFCLFLIFASIPIWGFMQFFSVSVYADSGSGSVGTDWNRVTTNDQMVQSFLAYCKSRDSNIVGGTANAVANFTYAMMQQLSKSVGIDLNELQAELYYKQESNGAIQWFMTSTGIQAYNSLFARLISENGFEVGEPADKALYSGKIFIDDDNNYCFVYIVQAFGTYPVIQRGTPYRGFTYADTLNSLSAGTETTYTLKYLNRDYPYTIRRATGDSYYTDGMYLKSSIGSGSYCFGEKGVRNASYTADGCVSIVYSQQSGQYKLGVFRESYNNGVSYGTYVDGPFVINMDQDNPPENITISFVSNNIKQEYQGDTYINNEGDNITNNNPGGQDPGWNVGGGQGSYSDGDGNSYTINFPDFELPDLNIDWSISGLGNKFPFSIPFDIVSLVTVLNAEPEAPRFQGTVNFGFTTWDYDINLQQFDAVAQVCRIAELLLLVFGLILITRSIIKG